MGARPHAACSSSRKESKQREHVRSGAKAWRPLSPGSHGPGSTVSRGLEEVQGREKGKRGQLPLSGSHTATYYVEIRLEHVRVLSSRERLCEIEEEWGAVTFHLRVFAFELRHSRREMPLVRLGPESQL